MEKAMDWELLWMHFKILFVQINFHPLLCAANETKHSHSSSSFITAG